MAHASSNGVIHRSPGPRRERGYAGLALALMGLIAATVLALPILNRASSALHGQTKIATYESNCVSSSAEQALWRITNDDAFLESLTGTPPQAEYTLDLTCGTATVTVTASSDEPEGYGLTALLLVDPTVIAPDIDTTVTYTMLVVNDDSVPHEINRIDARPIAFNPAYTNGSSTLQGLPTGDPAYTASRWRWEFFPGIEVGPFGGQAVLQWNMVVNEQEDNSANMTAGTVRFEGVGSISAPMSAGVTAGYAGDIEIQAVVTPNQMTAGAVTTFDYTITITNRGLDPVDTDRIEFDVTRRLGYVTGSTTGVTAADPHINHDIINDRWEHLWDLPPTTLAPGVPITLSFQQTGDLLPGIITATAAVYIPDTGEGEAAVVTTGETAPIISQRAFQIVAVEGGRTTIVEVLVLPGGVDVLSWLGS